VGLVRDWRVSSEPFRLDHRQIHYVVDQIQIQKKWAITPYSNWMGYRADLKSQLKNALNRFYSKEDLEMVSQFISDTIKKLL
jgi:hypothetical protein